MELVHLIQLVKIIHVKLFVVFHYFPFGVYMICRLIACSILILVICVFSLFSLSIIVNCIILFREEAIYFINYSLLFCFQFISALVSIILFRLFVLGLICSYFLGFLVWELRLSL